MVPKRAITLKAKEMRETIMTPAQKKAVFSLFRRNTDGAKDYDEFLARFTPGLCCSAEQDKPGDYVGGSWCQMYVGIETDGHTHT